MVIHDIRRECLFHSFVSFKQQPVNKSFYFIHLRRSTNTVYKIRSDQPGWMVRRIYTHIRTPLNRVETRLIRLQIGFYMVTFAALRTAEIVVVKHFQTWKTLMHRCRDTLVRQSERETWKYCWLSQNNQEYIHKASDEQKKMLWNISRDFNGLYWRVRCLRIDDDECDGGDGGGNTPSTEWRHDSLWWRHTCV